MLIPLHSIMSKYRMNVTGCIHVGAHFAEEHADYKANGIDRIVYIEASPKTFHILNNKIFDKDVRLINVACGDRECIAEMYCETSNQGQSSSLLQPGTHLKHYPNIQFNHTEKVKVVTLDSLKLTGYNFMNLDVQGFEGSVLRGATETLKTVDYVYTEVNTEDVYFGCIKVDQLDEILKDFQRVETMMTRQGWGDALYIRKSLLS